ncbi:MAG TPA: lamin tail domain-containing protein, partial [Pyrinomonadaceae bacterium]
MKKDFNNNSFIRPAASSSGQFPARQPVSRRFLAFFVFAILLFQQFAFFVPASAETFTLLAARAAVAVSDDIVISQVYGGGGNAGSVYRNDFIEIFNRGTGAISVTGWSVQYASATGSSWQKTDLTGTIPPGGYYLIQQAAGTGGTTNLPTPNATGNIAMSGTAGKVALVTNTTLLTCGGATNNCFPNAAIKDFLGYGTTANNYEGAPTANLSNTTAAIRNGNGCTDTDNNSTDFTLAAATPRNSASPNAPCSTSTNPSGTGTANPASVVAGGSTLLTVNVTP